MTEDEAKTKWCPFVRIVSSTIDGQGFTPAANRMVNSDYPEQTLLPKTGNCISSECMAWRWIDQQNLLDVVEWVQADPQKRKLEDFKARNPTNGFCGLAGTPNESS